MTGTSAIDRLRPEDPPRLGDYRIVGRIGRGGMGTVYLGESARGERVAVKVINPDLADDEMFRDRFRREVESARRVRRFCTAPVLDARIEGEPLFIVTEFVDGPDLDAFVRDGGPMRGAGLEHLAVGVATALTAIHAAGVIHRDLKPANVLLSSVGPRVIDFGIARALDTVSGATRTGQFIGTPAYMAPELVMGETATPASDVFAWGCVVAYAGTGRPPFDGPNVPAVLYRIAHGEPDLADLDESVRELVERALDKDPRRRPSAQELLDRLTGRPHADTAHAAETIGRTWSVPDEHLPPPQAGGGGTATASMPYGTPAPAAQADTHTWAAPSGRITRADAGPGGGTAPSHRRRLLLAGCAVAGVLVLGLGFVFALTGSDGPPSKTTPVYADDFSNTSSGWSGSTWLSGNGYFQGGYRLDAGGSVYQRRAEKVPSDKAAKDSPERALVSADVTVLSGPPYGMFGVFCRSTGDFEGTAYYDFLVRADGQGVLIRKVAGKSGSRELVRRQSAAGFKKHAKNHVQAACEQQSGKVRLRLWLNGTLAAEVSDGNGPLANGAPGLVAAQENGGSGGDIRVLFDNFDLSAIR
ncbi:serine/threonine protein kinase [Actinoallomurus spadix]|uniref:Protein kinase domain-containing protein n=1 Tax=Actinoallomurus spadix TaxID=79912 RepID=A0ABN0XU13_9ACTN|nr:serine/threonine-protein kinase [Actinoallomurus spadix]MCO5991126.1 serine/threonine protein kinase [Actinoallomurus spadix]